MNIPQKHLDDPVSMARAKKRPCDEIIQKAIANDVEQNKPAPADAFGIWEGRQVDGLDYQETIRSEW